MNCRQQLVANSFVARQLPVATVLLGFSAVLVGGLVLPSPALAQSTLKVLHTFVSGVADGANPYGTLSRDAAGNIYGTTTEGGLYNAGTVFKIDASGVETILHTFTTVDGASPQSGLLLGTDGSLYGEATEGGSYAVCHLGCGTIFKLGPSGIMTVLYKFTGGADGSAPAGGLTLGASGALYGTAYAGGAFGVGTIFKLDHTKQLTVLHAFAGASDGSTPYAGLTADGAGNFYGTTYRGGTLDLGTVFKLDATGAETILHSFVGGADGSLPDSRLFLDGAGDLFGTTGEGGFSNAGTIFEISPAGKKRVLHQFASGSDGAYPSSSLIRDGVGNFYGTTGGGGTSGEGTVYKLDRAGIVSVLYSFSGNERYPSGGVVRDAAGDLYGVTAGVSGGPDGTVYELTFP